jgi:hypothetical protein
MTKAKLETRLYAVIGASAMFGTFAHQGDWWWAFIFGAATIWAALPISEAIDKLEATEE